VEFLIEQEECLQINASTILNLHALLSSNLLGNPASCGRIRDVPVGVAKTAYTPLAIPQLIHEMFEMIIQKAKAIQDPFEQSFFLTVHIPYLQAFEDVNKRTSRLSANIPFFRENLCPLSFVDVPEKSYIEGLLGVYELNQTELLRDIYLWAYERSCRRYATMRQTTGEPDLIFQKYINQITTLIRKIITTPMNQTQAIANIEQSAALVPDQERQHFIEIIDNELMGLHPGNIARFKVKEHEYELWKKTWV
jgi:Fic family protein